MKLQIFARLAWIEEYLYNVVCPSWFLLSRKTNEFHLNLLLKGPISNDSAEQTRSLYFNKWSILLMGVCVCVCFGLCVCFLPGLCELRIITPAHSVLLCLVPSIHQSVRPSCPHYHSTTHNIQRILFIFNTAIDLSRSMNPIDYGVSMFIFVGSNGILKLYEYTDWLASWARPAEGSCLLDLIFFITPPHHTWRRVL